MTSIELEIKQQKELEEFKAHQQHILEEHKKREELKKKEHEKFEAFKHEMIEMAMNDYDFNLEQSSIIFDKAWDDGHAYGYDEAKNKMEEYIDFAVEIIKNM